MSKKPPADFIIKNVKCELVGNDNEKGKSPGNKLRVSFTIPADDYDQIIIIADKHKVQANKLMEDVLSHKIAEGVYAMKHEQVIFP